MDYGRQGGFVGGNIVQMGVEMQGLGGENWSAGGVEQGAWAGEDDYGVYSSEAVSIDAASDFNYDGRLGMSRSGSEPPSKKPRDSQFDNRDRDSVSRSKAIGKMFFKTKLCCKFRAGTCPYVTNCNFAHGIEELRKPPPNWQEIVAAQEEERAMIEPREEHQIPALSSTPVSGGESQRSYKGRHCKKFYTEEGCPYGDNCTFLHDEQSKARESVAISLGPTGGYGTGPNGPNQKPSNWKTRICNKWEVTGYCPFGAKCHFAHGMGELHRYGGGLVEEGRDSASGNADSKLSGGSAKVVAENAAVTGVVSSNHTVDIYHMGLSSQRSLGVCQRQGQRPTQKWKGPDKISLIYGDWLEEIDPDRI